MNSIAKAAGLTAAFMVLLLQHAVLAQRPHYAGPRPVNGLSQKDKYHINQSQNPELASRFGTVSDSSPATNQIAFGAPQRPPVGLVAVSPDRVYAVLVPTTVRAVRPSVNAGTTRVTVANRFGDTASVQPATVAGGNGGGSAGATATATATASSAAAAAAATPTRLPVRLPLDAKGDLLLVEHLNLIPEDRRPFWFLNFQAIEAQRNSSVANVASSVSKSASFAG